MLISIIRGSIRMQQLGIYIEELTFKAICVLAHVVWLKGVLTLGAFIHGAYFQVRAHFLVYDHVSLNYKNQCSQRYVCIIHGMVFVNTSESAIYWTTFGFLFLTNKIVVMVE